jgi:cellulose synthase/poly-beta-1,6-N-acetylglucosamine synthase-like glycosyltransferase
MHHWRNSEPEPTPEMDGEYPMVTVQLPIFNEQYVVERLIDNITSLDYPKDKLEIHVLDDSTDETLEISRKKVNEYKAKGFNIDLLTRDDRSGYKAGALKVATPKATGDLIAIFDADFLPYKDFLKKTIPYFSNSEIGVVQTRWEHINRDYSLLTRLQAFQLNVHFTIEQQGRESGNYLLQFNGTAGVWRKECIEDAGGWEADTLTEDLDLSYRAQIKGWKIAFLENIGAPAELPAEMHGLKSQQHRWMKGGAETAKKMLPTIWKSDLPLTMKLHGSAHLLASSVFLCVFIIGVFSVPLLFLIKPVGINMDNLMIFLISLVALIFVYLQANVLTNWEGENRLVKVIKFFTIFPLFLAISMGLAFHNSLAVIQGFLGKQTAFIRTPKYKLEDKSDSYLNKKYLDIKLNKGIIMEGLLTLYFLFAVVASFVIKDGSFLLFHIFLMIGYGTIFFYSVKHLRYK